MTALRLPFSRVRPAVTAPLPVQPLLVTLAVLALCMLPFVPHQPGWFNLLLALLLGLRATLALRGWKQPPAWTLVLGALLVARLLTFSYATLAGRDGERPPCCCSWPSRPSRPRAAEPRCSSRCWATS